MLFTSLFVFITLNQFHTVKSQRICTNECTIESDEDVFCDEYTACAYATISAGIFMSYTVYYIFQLNLRFVCIGYLINI